jgi:hypothetical protein
VLLEAIMEQHYDKRMILREWKTWLSNNGASDPPTAEHAARFYRHLVVRADHMLHFPTHGEDWQKLIERWLRKEGGLR